MTCGDSSQSSTRCDDQHKEVEYDLNDPRITVHKNTGTIHQNTVYCCNLKLAQMKVLPFFQTRSHAVVLFNTQPTTYFQKVILMKSKEELCNTVCVETHPNGESLTADLNNHQKFNLFSECRRNSSVAWETKRISSYARSFLRQHCQDCSLCLNETLNYFTCGKCLQPLERNPQLQQERYDVLSFPYNRDQNKNPVPWSSARTD